jgi:hypothetical protein
LPAGQIRARGEGDVGARRGTHESPSTPCVAW